MSKTFKTLAGITFTVVPLAKPRVGGGERGVGSGEGNLAWALLQREES